MWLTFWTLSCLFLLSNGRSTGSRTSSRPTSQSSSYPRQQTSTRNQGWSQPHPTTAPSYGWNRPTATTAPSYGWNRPTATTAPSYGWNRPTATSAPSYGWNRPTAKPATNQQHSPTAATPNTRNQPTTSYGWNQPKTAQPTSAPSYGWQKPKPTPASANSWQSATQKPFNNPVPQKPTQHFDPQKTSDNSYGKGYDHGYQRGVQQATRINPAYYPHQNQFGYPGQGIASGYHSAPTYAGIPMFGSANNYGYPISSSYGYNTYGTGNSDLTKGLLIGAVGGYVLNSAIHSVYSRPTIPQNSWGYSGSGYGQDYQYRRIENPTVINNNYFKTVKVDSDANNSDNKLPDNWVHCVAYDPMTDTTLTNPNCSCLVTLEIDPLTNTTTANHNCTSIYGHRFEKTPATDIEILDMIQSAKTAPEKLLTESEITKRRTMVYQQLNNIFTMGSFTA